MDANETGFLLPGATREAPYGVLKNGRPRLQPTHEQARILAKAKISPADYGLKTSPKEIPPERMEQNRAIGKQLGARAKEFRIKQKEAMAQAFGEDWREKGHKISELKLRRADAPAADDAPAELVLPPLKKRVRQTVGRRVASEVAAMLNRDELTARLAALEAKISAPAHANQTPAEKPSPPSVPQVSPPSVPQVSPPSVPQIPPPSVPQVPPPLAASTPRAGRLW